MHLLRILWGPVTLWSYNHPQTEGQISLSSRQQRAHLVLFAHFGINLQYKLNCVYFWWFEHTVGACTVRLERLLKHLLIDE